MKVGKYLNNEPLKINLEELIDSRLLIQANSGGGKSWALRKILEASHGKVQQIILDLEGEFSTLREEYDYLLIGKGGDIPINLKSAELLSQKILELNVSTIIDLYELKKHERILFVKRFLESLIDSPKRLWHPVLIVVDEAHIFCPEKTKSESANAVIDLMTRGRKRGFCGILATQRISKLHKDAGAEANNKMIGRTGLDIDRKRASDELGFTTKEQNLSLRNLKAGEFFVFGNAISQEVKLAKIGNVKTTHYQRGKRIIKKITPPTSRIKLMLKKLTDLPKEAEKELKTSKDMKREIHRLKIELRRKEFKIDEKQIEKEYQKGLKDSELNFKRKEIEFSKIIKGLEGSLKQIINTGSKALDIKMPEIKQIQRPITKTKPILTKIEKFTPTHTSYNPDEEIKVTGGASRILNACAMFYPKEVTKARMGAIAGLSFKSGTFGTYLATLKREGLIEGSGNAFKITNEGLEKAGDFEPIPSDPDSIIKMWANIVKGGASRMLETLAEVFPDGLTKEELGERAGITHTSGTFGTYLATLKRNGLIKVSGKEVQIAEELFE